MKITYDVYERPGKEYLLEWPELNKQVDSKNLELRYLPKQAYVDKY